MSSSVYEIAQLENVLLPHLPCGAHILNYSICALTQLGENYGSLMLDVNVSLEDKTGKGVQSVNVVAKMLPTNEWLRKMFQVSDTFKKEVNFYEIIVPTLRDFQKEQGMNVPEDLFPKCTGSRFNLKPPSQEVDDDAILLLENLKCSGYECVDRLIGFDYQSARLIIKNLAAFHAVPIAFKLLRPEEFKKTIMPILHNLHPFSVSDEVEEQMNQQLVDKLNLNPKVAPYADRLLQAIRSCSQSSKNPSPPREVFATISHNDFWTNNTMVKFVNEQAVHNKIIDMQIITYDSLAKDLSFFLFSSVQSLVLEEHYEDLVRFYFDTFVAILEELKCDSKTFTYDLLKEEIGLTMKSTELLHVLVMLRPIYSIKENLQDMNDMDETTLLSDDTLSDSYYSRLYYLVENFAKKGWL